MKERLLSQDNGQLWDCDRDVLLGAHRSVHLVVKRCGTLKHVPPRTQRPTRSIRT